MIAFIGRRFIWALFVVVAVVTIVFNVLFGIGDPAAATLGEKAGKAQLEALRKKHGFDAPVFQQYLSYVGLVPCVRGADPAHERGERCGLLQGNMGHSLRQNEPVGDVIVTRFPRTLLLGLVAMTFELTIGLFIGVLAAARRNTWLDTGFMALAFLGISAPTFLTGLLFLDWWAFRLGWFPVGGYGYTPLEHLQHALLPAFTLAIIGAATYARIMRSEMIDTLRADFIRTAHAKGVRPLRVLLRHAVRNALLPIVTLMGLHMAILVSGAVITESIYAWPGMGLLAVESIVNLDVFTIMGVVLFASATVQVGNLLADIAVASLDPRIRLG